MIFGFFNNPQREARRLNRDASTIVGMARETYRAERNREAALLVRDGIAQIAGRCGDDAACREREIDRLESLHREARRQNNQVGLTGYTLIIIYVRAQAYGVACAEARRLIDEFVQEWSHAGDEQGTLPG